MFNIDCCSLAVVCVGYNDGYCKFHGITCINDGAVHCFKARITFVLYKPDNFDRPRVKDPLTNRHQSQHDRLLWSPATPHQWSRYHGGATYKVSVIYPVLFFIFYFHEFLVSITGRTKRRENTSMAENLRLDSRIGAKSLTIQLHPFSHQIPKTAVSA